MLAQLQVSPPLKYWIADEAIVIAPDYANARSLCRVYDVRDIIDRTEADKVAQGWRPEFSELLKVYSARPSRATSADELIDGLFSPMEQAIDPDTWKDSGGWAGSLRQAGGLLIVTQTPENQIKVEAFLQDLRDDTTGEETGS